MAQWDLGRVNRKVEVCRLLAEALPTLTHAQPTNPVVCGFTFCRHSRTLAMYSSWHLYGWKGKSTVTPFRVILGMLACSQEGTEVGQNAAVRLRQNPLRTSQGLSHSRGMMPAVTLGHDTVLHRNPYGMDTRQQQSVPGHVSSRLRQPLPRTRSKGKPAPSVTRRLGRRRP